MCGCVDMWGSYRTIFEDTFLDSHLHHADLIQLINLAPSTPEEARLLLPSLEESGLGTDDIQRILDEIAKYHETSVFDL